MTNNKKELLTINLETWTEMVREDERKSIKIATLEHALKEYENEFKDVFKKIEEVMTKDEEDEVDEEATLKMWEEEKANE